MKKLLTASIGVIAACSASSGVLAEVGDLLENQAPKARHFRLLMDKTGVDLTEVEGRTSRLPTSSGGLLGSIYQELEESAARVAYGQCSHANFSKC